MRVGYVPHSQDLQHPADRRRLGAWASEKKITLNVINPLDSDILVLSNAANFSYWISRATQPVILDLVDGYLGENPSFLKDLVRNIVRSIRGNSNLRWITYTNHLRQACIMSDAVIVASPEQRDLITSLNKHIFVIPDDHAEIDSAISAAENAKSPAYERELKKYIFWEGFGFTLKHFDFMAKELDQFLKDCKWGMYLVTNEEFPRWGGYIGRVQTKNLIKKKFPQSWSSIEIIPWSLQNLVIYSGKSEFAIIPIDSSDKFALLKSENKLLSMWHLKLIALTSPIPSYARVAKNMEMQEMLIEPDKWYVALSAYAGDNSRYIKLRNSSSAYLEKHHTHSILVEKWDQVLKSCI